MRNLSNILLSCHHFKKNAYLGLENKYLDCLYTSTTNCRPIKCTSKTLYFSVWSTTGRTWCPGKFSEPSSGEDLIRRTLGLPSPHTELSQFFPCNCTVIRVWIKIINTKETLYLLLNFQPQRTSNLELKSLYKQKLQFK